MRPDYADVRFDCPERVDFEGLAVGDSASMAVSGLDLADFVRYAGASGDFTPFHYDREYAREEGYDDVFAQGMLDAGLAGALLTRWLGRGAITRFAVEFRSIVWAGSDLEIEAEVVARDPDAREVECELVAEDGDGEVAIEGEAAATFPP